MLKSKNICFLIIFIFTTAIILTACGNRHIDGLQTSSEETGSVSVSSSVNEPVTNDQNTESSSKATTLAEKPITTKSENKTTKATNGESTTIKKKDYLEFSYKNLQGKTVTYTENPRNKYILSASKQLKISAERLSISYYSNQAAIIVFSSAKKNKDTIIDCYLVYSLETMEIEKTIRKDGVKGNNKSYGEFVYVLSMKYKPG